MNKFQPFLHNPLKTIRRQYDIGEVAIYKNLEYLKLFSYEWY